MNIGDLVKDEWGDLAIIVSRVGFVKGRWRIRYLFTGGKATVWEQMLYPLDPSETQKKKFQKILDKSFRTHYIIYTKHRNPLTTELP